MDRNCDVDVSFWEDSDSERAQIELRSWGSVSELRADGGGLRAYAELERPEIGRLLEALHTAESKRVDSRAGVLEAIRAVQKAFDYANDDEEFDLHLAIGAEMPISMSGRVKLKARHLVTRFKEDGSEETNWE